MFADAIVLGVVEGITEFLPVSSTGHLIVVGSLLGFTGEKAESFEIFIQLGAILAVVVLYWKRFVGLLDFRPGVQGFAGQAGLIRLIAACLPALLLGAALHRVIKAQLFNPLSVALAFVTGGVILILVEGRKGVLTKVGSIDQISVRTSLLIGCFQCLSLWPGMSRAGATIIGGMLLGLERRVAAEFSFLVAVPVMCAAVSKDLFSVWPLLQLQDLSFFAVGFMVSFFTALLAVKFFISLLGRITFVPFGWYRVVAGAALLYFWH